MPDQPLFHSTQALFPWSLFEHGLTVIWDKCKNSIFSHLSSSRFQFGSCTLLSALHLRTSNLSKCLFEPVLQDPKLVCQIELAVRLRCYCSLPLFSKSLNIASKSANVGSLWLASFRISIIWNWWDLCRFDTLVAFLIRPFEPIARSHLFVTFVRSVGYKYELNE